MDMQSKAKKLIEMIQTAPVEWKPLGEVASIGKGKQLNKSILKEKDKYPVINGGINPSGYWHEYNNEAGTIVISQGGASAGFVNWMDIPFFAGAHAYTIKANEDKLLQRFAYYFLKMKQITFMQCQYGAGIPALAKSELQNLLIPIPPLETQQKIVKILDKFTELEATLEAELALRKRQYQYYRDFLLDFDNQIGGGIVDGYKGRLKDVVWKTLGEVCENLDSMRKPITSNFRKAGNVPYYGASGIVDYVEDFILDGDYLLVSEDGANLLARKTPIAFSVSGKIWVNNHAHILKFRTYAERRFIEFYLNNIDISMYISGAAQPKLNKQNLNKIRIPIPPLPEQEKIVAILDKFDTLTHSISEGLPHEIALRRKQYEYYREQLLAFPKAA
ncbi:restriction endonuclease subunit S [Neisseria meningitidis]|uniref:restriction endonuclease subunit S n=1 Tax=Neisseria meningitidis TaxID=487 RepID=UPI003861CAE3